ncbi:coiled-coil domain-containing protein 187 isoform X1 [Ctenopharyngodon idella]|uniref:coiled-coil domain-containing protein 187 isoform X1 n=2 Tax=Ctenopharyngodon idella TaxID=7959 RepID=UPI0022300B87|nr:coiled-coil domain-containing protein 187 isoform X1 [Ctenopharyngodon idella]XP_051735050.1 coiled-coil domain-containing protein 187 isoform X1 [Ctenopharyngodon idella]
MAELEVDQSNLPRVQEVCQCFAVLEDGALAHNLQEQEIEQYYNSNVQRNQLVQRDIRVAKRLQDEEEQRAQMLQEQATRQLEERDSEYAHMIQEEIQRRAEEALRREVEDEEIAKRIQEEEELCVRHRSSYQNKDGRESTSIPARPYSPHAPHNRSPTRRWQLSSSPTYSDSEEELIEYSRPTVIRQDSKLTVGQRKLVRRPSRAHLEQDNRSVTSQSSSSRSSHLSGGWGDVIKLIKNDMSEQGYLSHSSEDDLFEPVYKLEKILRQKQQVPGKRMSRHSSMREDHSRTWQGDSCGHRESFRERHVHFPDERRCSRGNSCRTSENGYSDTRERVQCSTGILRDDHTHLRETAGLQTQAQVFRRNISMRRSYHGNVRRTSVREGSRTCSVDDSNLTRARLSNNAPSLRPRAPQLMEVEDRLRDTGRLEMMRARNTRQRARSLAEDERRIEGDHRRGDSRVRRSQSERWQTFEEERSSTEEEMERESRREERRMQKRQSSGAGSAFRSGMAALDLGDLEQVLLDEELARRLQEEEERLAEETQQGSSPLRRDCPVGDFRAAQVAQDEEIARFMQKQEIKAKRRSRELEHAGPGREYRENDRRAACDRQRQRLDSEGLQSPVDDSTPSQNSMTMQSQAIRNIAEELDPTFQRKDADEAGQINGPCQNQTSQVGLYNPLEEPTFVPPTKRQSDKLGRVKPKEKKENAKQKENCKQQ